MRLMCSLGLYLTLLHVSTCLLLGAFNIQTFGKKKVNDTNLMDIITTIVHRYDIILIQEVRDSDLSATKKLMEHVNRGSPQPVYNYIVSEPLGKNSYKERYLFLYREATVSVVKTYTNNDWKNKFSREPFVVMFASTQTVVSEFVLIPQHTSPSKAVEELTALYEVVVEVHTQWKTNDIVLLGDFNAGSNYVSASKRQQIPLFTDNNLHWLIANDVDTTVSSSSHAYDRIVVTTDMMRGVVRDSAAVYNYTLDLDLSDSVAKNVSDHFPVEVRLSDQAAP